MAGAIIPDDWDGSTFNCYRINWPQSEKYEAILLGSVTEPAFLNFWDPETGDEEQAADAIEDAYISTIPDFWTKECDEPMLVPTFKVVKTASQAVAAAGWHIVTWDSLMWDENSPGFNLGTETHTPPEDQLGLWHYDLILSMEVAAGNNWIRAIDFVTNDEIARAGHNSKFLQLSFDFLWEDRTVALGIMQYPTVAGDIDPDDFKTHWTGYYVGPVE